MRLLLVLALLLAAPAAAGTRLSGDRIDGVPVAAALHVDDLGPGRHDFWYRVEDNAIGQGWYVPVIVLRGERPGPRLLLTAGIHGDELNGIDVIHRLARTIDPKALKGTLVMMPGLNVPGLLNSTRGFTPSGGTGGENLNRLMPGKPAGDAGAAHYAWSLWQLMRPNADLAIDLHTQSRGTAYVMYAFASDAATLAMARLVAPDMIKLDRGVKGTIENMLVADGVPAITLELGRPESFDPVMVERAVAGIARVMAANGMIAKAAPAANASFVGNKLVELQASRGGFAEILPPLGGEVREGQLVAVIRDAFGRPVEEIHTPVGGRVNTLATDPRSNPGNMLMRVLFWSDEPGCAEGC